jgi:hypothetical protein
VAGGDQHVLIAARFFTRHFSLVTRCFAAVTLRAARADEFGDLAICDYDSLG